MTMLTVLSRPRARAALTSLTAAAGAVLLAGCSSSGDSGSPGRTTAASVAAPATGETGGSVSGSATVSAAPSPQARVGAVTVLTKGLEVPWGVAFLPDGSALVSERISHRIVKVSSTGATTAVGTVPGVADDAGEGGLLGLALSPSFATDHLVYAYLTSATDNRVVRFTYTAAGLGTVSPVFTGIPKAGNHDGGRLAFGPDKLLYVTAGDANQRDRAPDTDYLGGKVLRMTTDGKPAPGNPDPSSVVWTRGHRNPQGLAFAPDGTLYEAEFGQNSLDEVNKLQGGKDYGWPSVEGTEGSAPGKTAPLLTFRTSDASPSGLAYAGGSLWLGALGGQRLYRIPVNTDGSLGTPTALLEGTYGRLRTVVTAPDGSLWVTTTNRDGRGSPTADDDRILRVALA